MGGAVSRTGETEEEETARVRILWGGFAGYEEN